MAIRSGIITVFFPFIASATMGYEAKLVQPGMIRARIFTVVGGGKEWGSLTEGFIRRGPGIVVGKSGLGCVGAGPGLLIGWWEYFLNRLPRIFWRYWQL